MKKIYYATYFGKTVIGIYTSARAAKTAVKEWDERYGFFHIDEWYRILEVEAYDKPDARVRASNLLNFDDNPLHCRYNGKKWEWVLYI